MADDKFAPFLPPPIDPHHLVTAANGISFAAAIGAFFGYLPTISAAVSIVWLSIEIWESRVGRVIRSHLRYHLACIKDRFYGRYSNRYPRRCHHYLETRLGRCMTL
jgi:hypothetical protein